jgi:3-oxoacyl-[acyl-carrier protein] reductase
VAVADVDPERAREAAEELIVAGARALPLVGDVRPRSDVDGSSPTRSPSSAGSTRW